MAVDAETSDAAVRKHFEAEVGVLFFICYGPCLSLVRAAGLDGQDFRPVREGFFVDVLGCICCSSRVRRRW